ncbi:helix-turn-helix domain-containing protein, partial [Brooklawnia sp.]|uniref:helix-turn-helix domain-containing protein n=1 Tax=Brooklawnia sp. TaxID=2699740 RepID=UPI00311E4B1F
RQKLVDAYASGMPVKQIAERFGVHRTTITQIVASAGIKVRSQPLAASTREEARHLYDSGRSLAQVAVQLGVSASAVRSAVLVTGGTLRSAGGSARNRADGDVCGVGVLDPQADETAIVVAKRGT